MTSEPSRQSSNAPADVFATTHWTVVLAAGRKRTSQAVVALEELCRTYWFPLYAFVRRRGYSKEDAEDLTQAFFARFLENNYLEGLRGEKGRFRAFLLASLKHFLANEWDKSQRKKRGGGVTPLALDWQEADSRYQLDPADQLSPDKLYDRAWAVALLERVIVRLRNESVAGRESELFEQLKPFLMIGKGAIPYPQAAAELDLTEGAVRVAPSIVCARGIARCCVTRSPKRSSTRHRWTKRCARCSTRSRLDRHRWGTEATGWSFGLRSWGESGHGPGRVGCRCSSQ